MSDPVELRTLKQWQTDEESNDGTLQLAVPLPPSSSGKYYRRCPDAECAPGKFLVDGSVAANPGAPGCESATLTCPYCGTDGALHEFTDPEDVRYAKEQVAWAARRDVQAHIEAALRSCEFDASPSDPIQVSCSFTPAPPVPAPPEPERADLPRNLNCSSCQAAYGVWSVALFCPACGSCALVDHMEREAELALSAISEELTRTGVHGEEFAYRQIGNAHEDLVSAMEAISKSAYVFVARTRNANRFTRALPLNVGNAFQNVGRSRAKFAQLGVDPFSVLDPADLTWLCGAIQRRHVITHNASMIDVKYARAVAGAAEGEVVPVAGPDIRRLAGIVGLVIGSLAGQLPEFHSPGDPSS